MTDFNKFRVNDSSYTKGTNMSESMPNGWFIVHSCTNGCHKTHNGWYLGLMVPVFSIVGLLVLYS